MVGPIRPQFVLFGSSIVQFSFGKNGWGSILAEIYARKAQPSDLGAPKYLKINECAKDWPPDPSLMVKSVTTVEVADIVLRGYAGWNSRRALEVLDQVFPKEATIQPSLVIVYFGGNDSVSPHPSGLGTHVPLLEYIENMKKIAIHLKSLSEKTRVIFLSSPPVNEAQICEHFGYRFGQLDRTNELCRIYSEACVDLCQELDVKVIDLWSEIQKQSDWLTACFTDGIHLSSEGSKIVVKAILKMLKETDWEPHLHWKSLLTEFAENSPQYPLGPDDKTTLNVSNYNSHWETNWE